MQLDIQFLEQFGITYQKDIFDFLEGDLKNLTEREKKKREFDRKVEVFKQLQFLPLSKKIEFSKLKIEEFYNKMDGKVYISFSGGKDSLVLLHLVKSIYPYTPIVFINTGNEFPELYKYLKNNFKDIIVLRPKIDYKKVIFRYGFPLIGKNIAHNLNQLKNTKSQKLKNIRLNGSKKGNAGRVPIKWQFLANADFDISEKCCYHLKESPAIKFEKETNLKPFLGITLQESGLRFVSGIKNGCNIYSIKRPKSRPLLIFTEKDIWAYIKKYNLPYCELYDRGEKNLGCRFCGFGIHYDLKRFNRLLEHYPKYTNKLLNYTNNDVTYRDALNYIGINL